MSIRNVLARTKGVLSNSGVDEARSNVDGFEWKSSFLTADFDDIPAATIWRIIYTIQYRQKI